MAFSFENAIEHYKDTYLIKLYKTTINSILPNMQFALEGQGMKIPRSFSIQNHCHLRRIRAQDPLDVRVEKVQA